MSCDLTNGRLLEACSLGRSGIKTLYFTKFNDFDALTGIVEADGEITDLGADPITIYQFDMSDNVGNFDEALTTAKDNGTSFVTQLITLTLLNVQPADLANLNSLKRGRWAIWALDFQGKIRLFGRLRGCTASGGSDVSGVAPGDKKGVDLQLTAVENSYAVFMEDYTTVPFDNFANVTIILDEYGPELHTDANAASDPNGNEADATTGWTPTGLSGTGANVFESQSAIKNVGGFALHADANDTPTSAARWERTFTVEAAATYRVSLDARHVGLGGNWIFFADGNTVCTIGSSDLTFVSYELEFVASGVSIDVKFQEVNGGNDGGVYADNISLRKKL